jgi:hypothetical protein
MKIKKYTSNPEQWVYRAYIDETVLNISSLMHNVLGITKQDILEHEKTLQSKHEKHSNKTKTSKTPKKTKKWYKKHNHKTLKNKTNNNIINELDPNFPRIKKFVMFNYNIFIFIETLLKKYIHHITNDKNNTDSKYDNIEIYTYSNTDLQNKLLSDPSKLISPDVATYGTLMRYHPLTEQNVSAVIMRNCSHTLTPFDLIVQNYWMLEEKDKEFMEYVDRTYKFAGHRNLPGRKLWYMSLYHKSTNTKHTSAEKMRHYLYDRVMAGLISCKLNNKDSYNKINNFFNYDNHN